MLRDSQEVASYFCSIDEESKVYILVSKWLKFCCSRLEILGKRLTIDDIMTENKVTQVRAGARSGRDIDKLGSSNRRYRCR